MQRPADRALDLARLGRDLEAMLRMSRTLVGSACVVVGGCAAASSASSTAPNLPVTGVSLRRSTLAGHG
jgi:hypothetical protein